MSVQLARSLRAVGRHWRIVVLLPLLAIIVSLVVSSRSPTEYTATAKMVLSPYNPVTQLLSPGSNPTPADPERDLNTEVSEITETPLANSVRQSLGLHESSTDLLRHVSANLEGTTNIVDITVTDASASRAAAIANAFASGDVGLRLSSLRATLDQSVSRFEQQLLALTPAHRAAPAGRQLESDIGTLQADSAGLTSDAAVSQPATAPASASQPRPLRDALIAGVVGLLVALIAVVVLELLDRTVRGEEDAVAVSGLPSLGMIPRSTSHATAVARSTAAQLRGGRRRGERRPPDGPWHARPSRPSDGLAATSAAAQAGAPSANGAPAKAHRGRPADWELAESYSALAVSLLALRLGPQENILMVTSPGPRDGKTSVSLGLAAALAELGQRVVAIECDLRRPRFAEYLGLPAAGRGLSSILAGDAAPPAVMVDIDAATQRALPATPARGSRAGGASTSAARPGRVFSVLPCGPVPAAPLTLLRGPELQPLLRQLQTDADLILIDTPPLVGALKDAALVATNVDQIMVVARAGHTQREALARCRGALAQVGIPQVGIVTVGGPRGGVLNYYLRPSLDGSLAGAREPKLVALRGPQPESRPEPEPLPRASKRQSEAVSKTARSQRHDGGEKSG